MFIISFSEAEVYAVSGAALSGTPSDTVSSSAIASSASIISTSRSSISWSRETCETLQRLMRNNVTEIYGQDKFGDLAVCAKSGTAEVGGGLDPHAWFVGFIDDPDHPYAFVVVVENGGWGSSTAGNIAAKVLRQACEEG